MANPSECRAKGVLRLVLVFAGVCFVGFKLYPPLFGVGQFDDMNNSAKVSCPACSCECPNDNDVFIPLEVLNISNTGADCGKNDAEMNEEMRKDNLDLLAEELTLQKTVANDTLVQTKALITSVRKASLHYQREAEKCSAGMEICEAARARAEEQLIEERKLSDLWERRALELGWNDSRST